ncbi:hypothetical protein MKX47_14435 [Solibacillus sp. FSL R7-0668]|uniref:hypothetical protein n=1 Tax=Solibacillus sp. FSL R7-0668 TaxID=2921688 RepID=UPI0030FCFA41
MRQKWSHLLVVALCMLVLSACGKSVEEKAAMGIENAQTAFTNEPNATNKSIGHIELYLPNGFNIEKGIDEANYTVINGKDSYILFVNPNETEDSRLHYDLIKQDVKTNTIEEQTYEKDGLFGFSVVNQLKEDQYELIVSVGGVKVTTISDEKKLEVKLQSMMEIAKSVKVIH